MLRFNDGIIKIESKVIKIESRSRLDSLPDEARPFKNSCLVSLNHNLENGRILRVTKLFP